MQLRTWCAWRPAVAGWNATLTACVSPDASAMCRSPPSRSKAACGAMHTRAVAGSRPVLRSSTACFAELPCASSQAAQEALAALQVLQIVIGLECCDACQTGQSLETRQSRLKQLHQRLLFQIGG